MRRREFIGSLAAAGAFRPEKGLASPFPVRLRKEPPWAALRRHIEPGHDEFPLEKESLEIRERLGRMAASGSLHLAEDFSGPSPYPARYVRLVKGVSRAEFGPEGGAFGPGLRKWLGAVTRASFYPLPGNVVRFEAAGESSYRVGHWKMAWTGEKLRRFEPLDETLVESEPLFTDVTGHAFASSRSFQEQLLRGVPYWRARLDSACGIDVYGNNGVAAGDIDNDGRDEIYVCQPGGLPNRLYKWDAAGRMEDITERAGVDVLDDTSCALFLDLRNAGLQDLVVLRASGPLLFLNRGDGTFRHAPDAFQFARQPQGTFTGMAAADYDRDGRPDLYLCSYIYFQSEDQYRYPVPYHDARNGPPNFLFRNEFTGKAGFFRDATAETGLDENNDRYSFAPAWCDYDGDGWPDLYVANDFGRNNLYRNRGGRFRDVAALAGVEDLGPGMSAAWFDYDGDGRPDLYVANMWTDVGQRVASEGKLEPKDSYRRHTKGNSLYRNRGDGTFEETGAVEGVEMGRWAWAADGFDFDNDGAPEILVTAGMITHGAHDAMSFFWRHVVARSPQSAQPAPDYENGWAALNEAIREDYSWSGNERNLFYVRRGGRYYDFSGVSGLDFAEDGRAFAVTDLDGDGNLDIVLKSRLGPQVRVLRNQCGTGRNVVALRLRGVKSNRDAIGARVEVNGKVQYVGAGSGYLSQHTKTLYFAVGDAAAGKVLVTWPSGTVQEFPELRAGQRHDVIEGESDVKSTPFRPRESWPASPVRGDNTMRLQSIRLMEPAPVPKCLAQGPGAVTVDARSDHETLAAAALLRRYLVDWRSDPELPLTFRLDDRGRLVGMAAGAGTELPASPLPFAGLYYAPPRRNWFRLGAAFYWAGYPEHALPYLFRAAEQSPGNAKSLLAIGQIQLDAGRLEEARTSTERALAIDAALAEAWNNLGGIEMAAGNHKRALGHYEKALSINGDLVYALVNAGQALARLGDDDGAERRFRRALEIRANDADAANQLGLLCARRDRLNEARTWFQRAIECKRDHAGAINNLGVLYMRLGRRDDAIAAYRFGIETAPDDEELYLNLGRIYAGSGEHERARQVMSQLLERRPSSAVARRALQELEAR